MIASPFKELLDKVMNHLAEKRPQFLTDLDFPVKSAGIG